MGSGAAAAYAAIRERVSFLPHDRETAPDIEALAELIQSRGLLESVRDAVELTSVEDHGAETADGRHPAHAPLMHRTTATQSQIPPSELFWRAALGRVSIDALFPSWHG